MSVNVYLERLERTSFDTMKFMFGDFEIGIKLNSAGAPVVVSDSKNPKRSEYDSQDLAMWIGIHEGQSEIMESTVQTAQRP